MIQNIDYHNIVLFLNSQLLYSFKGYVYINMLFKTNSFREHCYNTVYGKNIINYVIFVWNGNLFVFREFLINEYKEMNYYVLSIVLQSNSAMFDT